MKYFDWVRTAPDYAPNLARIVSACGGAYTRNLTTLTNNILPGSGGSLGMLWDSRTAAALLPDIILNPWAPVGITIDYGPFTSPNSFIFFPGLQNNNQLLAATLGAAQVNNPLAPGKVSSFLANILPSLNDWWEKYFTVIHAGVPTIVCGHSFGGVLAQASAMTTKGRKWAGSGRLQIISIGSPRMFDPIAALEVRAPHARLTREDDAVPKLPPRLWYSGWPFLPGINGPFFQYEHNAAAINLKIDGTMESQLNSKREPSVFSLEGLVGISSLAISTTSHDIDGYVEKLIYFPGTVGPPPFSSSEETFMAIPTLVVDDILECEIFGHADGQQIINRFELRVLSIPASPMPADTLCGHLINNFQSYIQPLLNQGYSVDIAKLKKITGARALTPAPRRPHPIAIEYGWQVIAAPAPPYTGGVAGAMLPTQVTVNAKKVATTSSRYARGHTSFGPISEIDTRTTGNLLENVTRVSWKTASDFFAGEQDIPTPTADPRTHVSFGIFSGTHFRWVNNGLLPLTDSWFDVSQYTISPNVGSQNSRKPRGYYQ